MSRAWYDTGTRRARSECVGSSNVSLGYGGGRNPHALALASPLVLKGWEALAWGLINRDFNNFVYRLNERPKFFDRRRDTVFRQCL